LFWKHLFPPFENDDTQEPMKPILLHNSRVALIQIIFALVDEDPSQTTWLLEDLNELVPFYIEGDGKLLRRAP
jgi:hypothetical protein